MASFTSPLASSAASNFTPDRLVISLDDVLSKKITVLSGQNIKRGALLGSVTLGGITVAAAGAGGGGSNTGNGTCVADVTTPLLTNARVGVYTAKCTVAGTNSATFRLTGPTGTVMGDFAFTGSGAAVTVSDQIKFAITDGSTDFIVGDGFTLTVAAGSGKYLLSLSAAADGSAVPDVILVQDVDATSGDKEGLAYYAGVFNSAAMIFGTGQTAASVFEVLREKGIYLPPAPQPAAF